MSFTRFKIILFNVVFFLLGIASWNFIAPKYFNEAKETAPPVSLQRRSTSWTDRKINLGEMFPMDMKDLRAKTFLNKLAKDIIPEDWNMELKKILEIEDVVEKRKILFLFFTKWAEKDFEMAMATAGKLGNFSYDIRKEMLCQLVEQEIFCKLTKSSW